jgi:hypothetical protein
VAFQGGPELQQIARGGARLERIGQIVGQIGIEIEDKVNDARAMEATNTFENGVAQAFLEYQQLKGKDGVDGYENFQKQVEELQDGAGSLLMNDMQRASAMPIFDKINSRFSLRAQEHYMGAAAEYKQQQVVAERIKLEDALRSEPLGANSVALFMRLRQNLAKEAEGLGYSEDRLDTHVLEGTSKLVNDLFNHYADSDRPEDALAFLKAVEVFEQSPMASEQGPTSLRGKTYAEAQAAAKADQTPVGAVMLEATREGLKRKAEKLSLDSWAIRTAATQTSLGAGFDYSQGLFDSGEISASQKDALDRRLIANQERRDKVRSIQGKKFYEQAKEDFLDNGKISQDMEDKLREFDLYDDYLDFASRKTADSRSRGNASATADAFKWGAWRAVNMNDKSMQRVADGIRQPQDLEEPYLVALQHGATPDQASKYAQDIAAIAFAEEVDANETLSNMGYETPSAARQSIGAYFDEQGQALRLQLGQEDPRTESDVWDRLMDEQRGIFVSKVQDQINILVSEDSKRPPREVTKEAIATVWNSRRATYREDGKDKVTNLWLESPAKAKAIQAMMAPGGGGKALQAYATDMRVVGGKKATFKQRRGAGPRSTPPLLQVIRGSDDRKPSVSSGR